MVTVESSNSKQTPLEDGGDACGGQYKQQRVSCIHDLLKGSSCISPSFRVVEPKSDNLQVPKSPSVEIMDCLLDLTSGDPLESSKISNPVGVKQPECASELCVQSPHYGKELRDVLGYSESEHIEVLKSSKSQIHSTLHLSKDPNELQLMAVPREVQGEISKPELVDIVGCSRQEDAFESIEVVKFVDGELSNIALCGESSEPEEDLLKIFYSMESQEFLKSLMFDINELCEVPDELESMEMPGDFVQGESSKPQSMDALGYLDRRELPDSLGTLKCDLKEQPWDAREGDSMAKNSSLTGQPSPQHGNEENAMHEEGSCGLTVKSQPKHANIVVPKDSSPNLIVKAGSQHQNTDIVRHKRGDLSPDSKVFHQYKNKGSTRYEERPSEKNGKYRKLSVNQKAQGEQSETREKVRETLCLFQELHMKFSLDDNASRKHLGKWNRADQKAFKHLKERGMIATKRYLGGVPGVEVGDEFHYRVELSIIGLHYPLMAGIDYMDYNGKIVATCIVSSGGYADARKSNGVLVYFGEGGHPGFEKRRKKPLGDQKLVRGNLALKNSIDEKTPVRLIHGFQEASLDSSTKKIVTTYVYDGLYFVQRYWSEMGPNGFNIFKFQLRKEAGQC